MKTPSAYVQNATGHPPAKSYRLRGLSQLVFRTANAAEMRLSGVTSTGNVAGVADGEWALISTYGDHPSPDGSYVQHFPRSQAEQVVKTWNSITGTAARFFKNLYHGFGAKSTCPVWEGHPDSDKQRWPKEKLLAEISALRLGESGLEGRITWNAKGLANRTRGPLFPSSLWWHFPPSGVPPVVFPELLESVGLWPNVNIPGLPAWTANATFSGESPEENQNENAMTPAQLAALARALNLPESTDAAKIIETAQSAYQLSTANAAKVQENETALQTANAAKADIETKLTTANAQLVTITAERDGLTTANATLTTANAAHTTEVTALRTGVLNLAEKKGAITPAERESFATRLSTANTAAATLAELLTRKAMHTAPVEINGNRVDLSTANARASALEGAVAKRMKDDVCDRDTAFARVQADPAFAPLFATMADPTKKAA